MIKTLKKIIKFLHLFLFSIMLPLYSVASVVVSWFFVLLLPPEKYNIHLFRIMKLWGRFAIFLSLSKVKIHNKESIGSIQEPYIVIANHQSFFDIFVCSGFLPIYFAYLSKDSIFNIPFIGNFMKNAGCVTVSRDSKKGMIKTIKQIMKLLKNKRNILIFPEGTRNRKLPHIAKFKKGFFQIAASLKVNILPIVIYNTNQILPDRFFINRKKIELDILTPITKDSKYHPANKNSPLSFEEKIEYFHNITQESYNKLANI